MHRFSRARHRVGEPRFSGSRHISSLADPSISLRCRRTGTGSPRKLTSVLPNAAVLEPDNAGPDSPTTTYKNRMAGLKLREQAFQREHIRLGYVRLAFGVALLILLLPPRFLAFLPFIAFVIAARAHGSVLRDLAATRRILASYEHATARLEDRWVGLHPRPTRADLSQSLYATDLDIFGPASLFELLCEARTSLGEDTLAAWLLAPAPTPAVLDRQAAIADLRSRLNLREAFAGAPGPALPVLDLPALTAWSERPSVSPPGWLRWLAPALVLLTAAAVWLSFDLRNYFPFVLMLAVNGTLTFAYRKAFPLLFAEAQTAARSLHSAAALLAAIEGETFNAPPLQSLQAKLRSSTSSAAHASSQLAALSDWIDARSNYVVRVLDTPLLYSLQLALIVKRWKQKHGLQLGTWLQVLGEFEALLSLAAYSYEHPRDPFPHVTPGPPGFAATGLAHPLLPATTCVRNDVNLGDPTRTLLISGSNMSGKSTLLRSVGINAVLAFVGAPVRADSLALSPLTVAASIQVNDSLQAGRSRFYAEILRLRAITEAAHTHPPVLFLIDEILAGTNSSDRLAGAQGVLDELTATGAIGLLSTHDLALTSLTSSASEQSRNMHFEDTIENGELSFDYKLREGVVERSNGLALMRLIGLDV